jgi:hypothetical protein
LGEFAAVYVELARWKQFTYLLERKEKNLQTEKKEKKKKQQFANKAL